MSAHTPGPWFVETLSRDSCNAAVLAGAEEIGAPGYDSMVASVVGRTSDNLANARLIAAAPDLLDACSQMVYADDFEDEIEASNALASMRAALAKARGEQ